MAEEINNNATEPTTTVVEESVSMADYEKLKSALDKALKEKGDLTKQYRAKLSEEDRLKAEREETERVRNEEFETLKAEYNKMKALSAYKSISNEKVVGKLIDAVSNADHNAIADIIKAEVEVAVKKAEAEWLNGRPEVAIGTTGVQMSKEEIMKIPDRAERHKAMMENYDLFK